MSKFALFMKGNKKAAKNEFYAATKSLCDEKGEALKWEFRRISSAENEEIRDSCMKEVPIPGKGYTYRTEFKAGLYARKLIVASVVMPDLKDSELQDSYGVKTPEGLLLAMVDNPGEYANLAAYVQRLNGFNTDIGELVEEAKN